jgi:transcriptional regulator with XRE-family HTH domain
MSASREVSANVRAELGRQSLTRADLARKLGESDMWLGRRLNDQVPITVDELVRIADALGVAPRLLLGGVAA